MAAPSRVTIAKPNRSNGVLSVPAAATQKKAPFKPAPPSSIRSKLVVRRLPPGLSQQEFEETLGQDWKLGAGKVTWVSYHEGKISKDPSKPSRPSRAYLHVTQQEHINALSDKVRSASFIDSKGTSRDVCLLGPPNVEFAPYSRIPNGKARKDARQGTIDQDPEFMSFLESLTNPIIKPASVDQDEDGSKSKSKVTTTPLVQYIKERKANKGKEQTAAKAAKGSKHDKETRSADGKNATASSGKRSASATKVEKAARDAVKVLNKQAAVVKAAAQSQTNPKAANATPAVAPNSAANSALAAKQRERGNFKSAAAILQRDLGISGSPRGRGGRNAAQNAAQKAVPAPAPVTTPVADQPASTTMASAEESKPADSSISQTAIETAASTAVESPAPASEAAPPSGPNPGRGPPQRASTMPQASKASSAPLTSTQAFLKHANPSQGITEPLLEESFAAFGTVLKVEIDKKKGFAYVDFALPEELQKAIKASPVKIAQGSVQVLERKTGSQLQAKQNARMGGAGGGGMNNPRGGGAPMGPGHHRGGASMGNSSYRGGRGGISGGGRGGHGRGRGGGRGGGGSGHTGSGKGAATTTTTTPTAPAVPAAQTPAPAPPATVSSETSAG